MKTKKQKGELFVIFDVVFRLSDLFGPPLPLPNPSPLIAACTPDIDSPRFPPSFSEYHSNPPPRHC